MRRSWLVWIMMVAVVTGGCASRKPVPPAAPLLTRGSLTLAPELRIVSASLPASFVPDPTYPPIWLRQGAEVGVFGTAAGKSTLIGLSGPGFSQQRVLAEDFGEGAPRGRLLAAAPSPDGSAIATVASVQGEDHVEVALRDLGGESKASSLAAIDGDFELAQLTFVDASTLALGLSPAAAESTGVLVIESQRSGLYLIKAGTPPELRELGRLGCATRQLSFSPSGHIAITAGDNETPSGLINLDDGTCRKLSARGPVQVVAWTPDSSAFLYFAIGEGGVPGIFAYDTSSGLSRVIAVASGAAAYADDGTIVALGDSRLTWQRAATSPDQPVDVEIAMQHVASGETNINRLGVASTPRMLARSRIVFSPAADSAVLDVLALSGTGPRRELFDYSYPTRMAFALAASTIDAPLALSWSPDGKAIAIVDGGAEPAQLMVIAPAPPPHKG